MALKGKQKKLDKNNNGRIDAEDFKILQGSKKGMRLGELVDTGNKKTPLRKAERKKESKPLGPTLGKPSGYGAARTSGMGLQDESMKPGKVMKPKKAMLGLYIADKALKQSDTARKRISLTGIPGMMASKYYGKKYGKSKGGMLKASSGKLAESMKKLREKAYEKSGKKYKGVGRYGKDEYMIQKKLPGMKTGKYVFDMVGVKPMSGLNKDKKKKDGFLDDVFEKTIKRYGLKDPTKKK